MSKRVNRKICLSAASKESVAMPSVDLFAFISLSGRCVSDKAITIDLIISSSNGFAKLLMCRWILHLATLEESTEAVC